MLDPSSILGLYSNADGKYIHLAPVFAEGAGEGYATKRMVMIGAATSCVIGVVMNVLTPHMVNDHEWNWGFKAG